MRLLHFTHKDENARPSEFLILTDDQTTPIGRQAKEYGRKGFKLACAMSFAERVEIGRALLPLDQPLVRED